MTLESITQALVKGYKTSTWWAMVALSVFIFGLAHFTNVSLAGVSTFGLLLIAMQALQFTKDQSMEWRRRDVLNRHDQIIYDNEYFFEMIQHTIEHAELSPQQPFTYYSESMRKLNYKEIEPHHYHEIMSNLNIIDQHLHRLGSEGIYSQMELIYSCIITHNICYHYTHTEPTEDNKEKLIKELGRLKIKINESLKNRLEIGFYIKKSIRDKARNAI